jgi:hypothetical protein
MPPTKLFVGVRTSAALLSRSPVLSSIQSFVTKILSQASHSAQCALVKHIVWRLL